MAFKVASRTLLLGFIYKPVCACRGPTVSRLGWVIKRARVMNASEICYRIHEQLQLFYMRRTARRPRGKSAEELDPSKFLFCRSLEPQLPTLPWRTSFSHHEQEYLLAGEWAALGYAWRWRNEPNVWRTAPDTGRLWPQAFFADIAYRENNPYGDVRIIWEPARLQQLVSLALFARTTSKGEAIQLAISLIDNQFQSWAVCNPLMMGIHYISAMECALRIIAICHAFDLVRGHFVGKRQTWAYIATMVLSHADFISRRLSLYSSTGNHTIAEAAGLVYAGVLFPEFDKAEVWRSIGVSILAREADRQILPDGGGVEQAFWYHLFVVDLFGLVEALCESYRIPVPEVMRTATRRGQKFLGDFYNGNGSLPPIGDSDDGYALSPRLNLSLQDAPPDRQKTVITRTYQSSGYSSIIDADLGPLVVILDHGPLGLPPNFGHGHADALSISVSIAGHNLLVDPGTFSYLGEPAWRQYFRGTRAHNTIVVDGTDQARQASPFMWTRAYTAELVHRMVDKKSRVILLSRHDGYEGVGVIHWRGVVYIPRTCLIAWDRLTGRGIHDLQLNWHCAGEINGTGPTKEITLGNAKIRLLVSGGSISCHSGETNPIQGWTAPKYGLRKPITTIIATARTQLPHTFISTIEFGPRDTPLPALDPIIATFEKLITCISKESIFSESPLTASI